MEWLDEIWHPDSFFKNAKDISSHSVVSNKYIWLYKDKSLFYSIK